MHAHGDRHPRVIQSNTPNNSVAVIRREEDSSTTRRRRRRRLCAIGQQLCIIEHQHTPCSRRARLHHPCHRAHGLCGQVERCVIQSTPKQRRPPAVTKRNRQQRLDSQSARQLFVKGKIKQWGIPHPGRELGEKLLDGVKPIGIKTAPRKTRVRKRKSRAERLFFFSVLIRLTRHHDAGTRVLFSLNSFCKVRPLRLGGATCNYGGIDVVRWKLHNRKGQATRTYLCGDAADLIDRRTRKLRHSTRICLRQLQQGADQCLRFLSVRILRVHVICVPIHAQLQRTPGGCARPFSPAAARFYWRWILRHHQCVRCGNVL
eukprot:Opistho-2@85873